MSRKKRFFFVVALATAFLIGYGGVTMAWPIKGRNAHQGYFTGAFDTSGDYVLRPDSGTGGCAAGGGLALPTWVDTPGEFTNFIICKLNSTNGNVHVRNQERTGAAFIIQTMIGTSRNRPPTAGEINDWIARVNYASSQGWIQWNVNYNFTINSYFQGNPVVGTSTPNDDAFYNDSGGGGAIIFWGSATPYVLRRQCANPVGNGDIGVLAPGQNFTITGSTSVSDTTVEPGQTFNFTHTLLNQGPTATDPTPIWWVGINTANGAATGGPASSGTYANGQSKIVQVESVTVPLNAVPFSTICRQIGWDPWTSSGLRNGRGTPVCTTVIPSFDLRPIITVLINGVPPPPNSVAEQGDTVQFQYSVTNNGITPSLPSAGCTIYRNSFTGYHPAPTPAESTVGWAGSSAGTGCPRVFPGGGVNTPLLTEPIVIGPGDVNRSLCRILEVNPSRYLGPPRFEESCVQVGTKPYLRVYGGDVSVGNGQPAACINSNSSIVTWNRENPTYSGAGVQYAAFAVNRINDFATALGNTAGAARPSGMAFANTTTVAPNIFGGLAGTLPCSADYYARRLLTPTSPLPSGNLSTLSGLRSYTANGPIALRGNINPNQQSVVYVNGDVLIDGDIRFTGNWNTAGDMPMFQLVVSGNIFISQNVTQLDGVYIAQPSGATNGIIHTCANTSLPAVAVSQNDTNVYSRCRNKLTINGSFVARDIRFLRTGGTLSQSNTFEAAGSANIAEVFKFSPAVWMQQPPMPSGTAANYDAITSLPPVL